jgi:hypothetical protein
MEPVTTIVTALALGAAAGLKPTAEQAVKDAYSGLKELIKTRYQNVSVELLEGDPASKTRQAVVLEDLAKTGVVSDEEVLQHVNILLEAVRNKAPESVTAIGVDLKNVTGASLQIADIISTGTGVKVQQAEFVGDIDIRGVISGLETGPVPKR